MTGYCTSGPCRVYRRVTPNDDLSQHEHGWYIKGDVVKVMCQSAGQTVTDGDTGKSSEVWARLEDGFYLSGLYLDTPESPNFSPSIPRC